MCGLWGLGTADLEGEGAGDGRAAIEDGSRAAVAGAENGSRGFVLVLGVLVAVVQDGLDT